MSNPELNETPTRAIPKIGEPAPDFTAVTTAGELTFSEWAADSWVVLFSHPADFTPVCSTELSEFARREPEFTERGAKLIGLSIDSIHSHLAWLQNLKSILKVDIGYPLIADLDMNVASLYGMVHPGAAQTATVRAVFVIDPTRTVRALVYYPLNVGRSVDEIVRLLDGLQTSDAHACATPVEWRPGQNVVVPPPKTAGEVLEREAKKSEYEHFDFYLNKREL